MLPPTRGPRVTALPSPFAQAAPNLSAMGWAPIPIVPPSVTRIKSAGKAPGSFVAGHWQAMSGWSKFRDCPPTTFQMSLWLQWPEAGCGVLLGTPAGFSPDGERLVLIGIDIDQDGDALDTLLRCLPTTPTAKAGNVGLTRFFRASEKITSRSYDRAPGQNGGGGRLVDLLAGGRQVVVPGSVHAKTGTPYVWIGEPVDVQSLPIFTESDLEVLEENLELLGWERPDVSARPSAAERTPRARGDYGSDEWAETNGEALARLGEWFPLLNLPKTRQTRSGTWTAVPTWRASNSGRPDELRKANLSASSGAGSVPAGIRDWGASGTDASLTAVDLVQRALDLGAGEAKDWLRETLGLNEDDGIVVDFSGMLAAQEQRAVEVTGPVESAGPVTALAAPAAVEATEQDGELPDHLTRVPGLVGQITDWIEATSRKPQRILAMAAAIGIVGTVAGRKFAGPTDSATHLFILGIAGTGAGKNAPKKAGAALLTAAGLRSLLGPGSFMSSSGLIQHVSRNPASLCILDEFGVYLARLNAKNNSTHERAISGDLRQLWSLSFEEFHPPKWANSAQRQEMAPIISPALSIIGLSTPDEFYASLQGSDIVSGFANRFLILATSKNPEDVEPTASVFDVPAQLIEGLQGIAGVGGALATATMHSLQADRPMVRVDWENGIGSAAHNVFKRLKAEIQSREGHEALMQRTAEMAVRLATIRAIGISGEHAEVSPDDMQWGADLALWSAERLIADVDTHMVESDHQMRAKMVLRIINESPDRTIGRTALCRKVNHRFDARTLDAVLLGLCDAGQVEELKECSSGRAGRKASGYRAVK